MKDPTDTASISFTGLYTGEVWYRNGLSPEFLSTRSGTRLYRLMTPFEALSRWLGGTNLRILLVQRHRIMDYLLARLIEDEGVDQVLEIACGMSARGYRFRRRFPSVQYVETDMPGMAGRKRRALEKAGCLDEQHRVRTLNAFHETGDQALEKVVTEEFTPGRPLVVITEGLTSYFTRDAFIPVWRRLGELGDRFPGSRYLMETYFVPQRGPFSRTIRRLSGLLGRLSDSSVSFHFRDDSEVHELFATLSFGEVCVYDPGQYKATLDLPAARGDPIVRVLSASMGRGN